MQFSLSFSSSLFSLFSLSSKKLPFETLALYILNNCFIKKQKSLLKWLNWTLDKWYMNSSKSLYNSMILLVFPPLQTACIFIAQISLKYKYDFINFCSLIKAFNFSLSYLISFIIFLFLWIIIFLFLIILSLPLFIIP